MSKNKKITEVYTVEITVTGWTDNLNHFQKLAKEQIKGIYIDIISAGISGSSSVKSKKITIIKQEPEHP
jgi:hypothetical protein